MDMYVYYCVGSEGMLPTLFDKADFVGGLRKRTSLRGVQLPFCFLHPCLH